MLAKYMVYKGHIRIRRLAHIGSEERMNKLKMKMKKTADVRPWRTSAAERGGGVAFGAMAQPMSNERPAT